MSSALSIAAGGIKTASAQFTSAAREIVQAGTNAHAATTSTAASAASTGAPVSIANFPAPDLFSGIIDLKLAEISYKANIKVFEAAARLEEEALNILT